jgi:hypothetical protein
MKVTRMEAIVSSLDDFSVERRSHEEHLSGEGWTNQKRRFGT